MVGVPGRSKGCHTCRRRKIRCDEAKPECNKCLRSGRVCEGYARVPIFLNKSADGTVRRDSPDKVEPQSKQSMLVYVSTPTTFAATHSGPNRRRDHPVRFDPDPDPFEISPVLASISQGGIEMMGYQGYLASKWVKRPSGSSSPKSDPFGMWMVQVIEMSQRDDVLQKALDAFVLNRMGAMTDNQQLISESKFLYSQALRALQRAISDPSKSASDHTLISGNIMKLYESYNLTSNDTGSYNAHVKGLERLLVHRGPQTSDDPLVQQIINAIRYGSMTTALEKRSASVLGTPQWRVKSWNGILDACNALYDVGFDLARTAGKIDVLRGIPPSDRANILVKECFLELTQGTRALQGWHQQLIKKVRLPLPWYDPDSTPERQVIAGMSWQEDTATISCNEQTQNQLMIDYWALSLCFGFMSLQIFLRLPADLGYALDCVGPPERGFQWSANILSTAKKLLGPDAGIYSQLRSVFPVRVAQGPLMLNHTPLANALREQLKPLVEMAEEQRGLLHLRALRTAPGWENPDGKADFGVSIKDRASLGLPESTPMPLVV